MPEYEERDFENKSFRKHYEKHVNAMTTESLYNKSDIAAELAYRDAEIQKWRLIALDLSAEIKKLQNDHKRKNKSEFDGLDFLPRIHG